MPEKFLDGTPYTKLFLTLVLRDVLQMNGQLVARAIECYDIFGSDVQLSCSV